MPTVYDLKPKFQSLLRPLVRFLAAIGLTANSLTVGAFGLSMAGGLWIYAHRETSSSVWILPLILFVRMALNAMDGMLAKEHNQKSNLGACLNELGDVCSDVALYLPLAFISEFEPHLVVALVLVGVIVEFSGLLAHAVGVARRYDGPMGKSDRAFWIGCLCLGVSVFHLGQWMVSGGLSLMILLSLVTISNRIKRALEATV
jgi:CDP-diacylglycerol--glycerol-3-phosphate 3-phosphatidyltransferase